MNREGVIKFNCHWIRSEPLREELISDLNYWRNKMYESGLIGVGEDGIVHLRRYRLIKTRATQ